MSKEKSPISCGGSGQCPIEFLTELLEKMVSAQINQSERMAEMRQKTNECYEKINWVKEQFTNGFRSEIKTHITSAVNQHNDIAKEILETLEKEVHSIVQKINRLRNPRFWIKVGVGLIISIATTILTMHKIYDTIIEHSAPITELNRNYELLNKNYDLLKQNNILRHQIDKNVATQPS